MIRFIARLLFVGCLLAFVTTTRAELPTASVSVSTPGGFVPLKTGVELFGSSGRYVWDSFNLPTAEDLLFWRMQGGVSFPQVEDGRVTFSADSSGTAWMLTTDRYGGGGNSSGDWLPEVSTEQELAADGWLKTSFGATDRVITSSDPNLSYELWQRNVQAGDTFTLRTEKYIPPIVLLDPDVAPFSFTDFVIDPAQSYINVSLGVGAPPTFAIEQLPGSLTASLTGSLSVRQGNGTIAIYEAAIEPMANPGPFAPGAAPADFAAKIVDDNGAGIYAALRDLLISFGGVDENLAADGSFDSSGVFRFLAGTADVSLGSLLFSESMTSVDNNPINITGPGELVRVGNQWRLTLPIFASADVPNSSFLPVPFTYGFQGQIVAYAAVPEFGSSTLIGLTVITIVFFQVRRYRQRV